MCLTSYNLLHIAQYNKELIEETMERSFNAKDHLTDGDYLIICDALKESYECCTLIEKRVKQFDTFPLDDMTITKNIMTNINDKVEEAGDMIQGAYCKDAVDRGMREREQWLNAIMCAQKIMFTK